MPRAVELAYQEAPGGGAGQSDIPRWRSRPIRKPALSQRLLSAPRSQSFLTVGQ
ncbi:Hypothetical predicted protein, partial [Marmota monax]